MSDLKIVLVHADAREDRTVTTGTKAWELFADDTAVIAARVNGELKDLAYELADGDEVEGVAIDSADGHDILRHSTAHVMAQAVQQLFPDAKLGIGPPIENGFYYDFDVETPFVPEDLAKIETAMRKIIKEGQRFERRVTTDARRDRRAAGRALQDRADRPQGRGQGRRRGRGRERRGRRRRADDLRQRPPQRRRRLERPVPRPAPADHQADPGVQADALAPRPTGAATRRTSSSSASTAPPGSPRRRSRSTCTGSRRPSAATTASSAATSTSSASPTRSAPACRSSTPRAA